MTKPFVNASFHPPLRVSTCCEDSEGATGPSSNSKAWQRRQRALGTFRLFTRMLLRDRIQVAGSMTQLGKLCSTRVWLPIFRQRAAMAIEGNLFEDPVRDRAFRKTAWRRSSSSKVTDVKSQTPSCASGSDLTILDLSRLKDALPLEFSRSLWAALFLPNSHHPLTRNENLASTSPATQPGLRALDENPPPSVCRALP